MFLNGILGGLVAITAGADIMSPMESLIIGGIAGPIVVLGISILDNLNLDDPVGAISVHLFCGVWGTLSVGLFGSLAGWNQFISQLIGIACYATICLASSFIIFYVLKKTIGLRVSERHELEGLDLHEHGMNSYPDFRLNEH
jgi:Amt family ammonium transporter